MEPQSLIEKRVKMIVVRRTYLPKPGSGTSLLKLVQQAADEMANAGFPKPEVFKAWHGGHGTVFTDQRWDSVIAYEESRNAVRRTSAITSIFDEIYPLLAETHDTHHPVAKADYYEDQKPEAKRRASSATVAPS